MKLLHEYTFTWGNYIQHRRLYEHETSYYEFIYQADLTTLHVITGSQLRYASPQRAHPGFWKIHFVRNDDTSIPSIPGYLYPPQDCTEERWQRLKDEPWAALLEAVL